MPTSDLAHRLADSILEMIESSQISAGAHLSTPKLAERFDVSRSPVREALQLLAERQVIAKEPRRGFFVRDGRPGSEAPARGGERADPVGYRQIAEDWLDDLVPSEVTEQSLRERYGLSSAELAKVLALGASEGWIERKGGYGWRLLPVAKTSEALEHIYRVRLMIEPAALLEPGFALDRKALETHRAAQCRLLDGGIETAAPSFLIAAGAQFHEDVARMSGNPFLHQTLVRLNRVRRLVDFRSMEGSRKRLHLQCRQHVEIIDLIAAGANVEASHLMRRHVNGAISVKAAVHRIRRAVGET